MGVTPDLQNHTHPSSKYSIIMQIKEFTSHHWTINQSKVGTHADEDTKIHAEKQGNHTTRVSKYII